MKIGDAANPAVTTKTSTTRTGQAAEPIKAGPGPSSDPIKVGPGQGVEESTQVALSSTASTMRTGATAANSDFDAEKVAQITAQIAAGTFKPNAEVIADKLITNAVEVGSRVGRS